MKATDFGYITQVDQASYTPQPTKARLYCPKTKLMMVTVKYLATGRIWLYFIKVWNCPVCTVNFKSKTVFDEHWTQKHSFLFCILNIIEGDWLWIHKTEWPAFLFSTANKGLSILSRNKTDDRYRKISSTRKNLALFHLSLKLSSVYCQLQIQNCFWWTFNSKTYFLMLYFEYNLRQLTLDT